MADLKNAEQCIGACVWNNSEPCGQCPRSRAILAGLSQHCAKAPDQQHCNDWFDGGQCHFCGAAAMTDAERQAQGMIHAAGTEGKTP